MDINSARQRRANELKQMRLECKITQVELAEISTLTQATISRIECGKIGWNIDSELIYFETLNKILNDNRKKTC